jgi:hypothetical protein
MKNECKGINKKLLIQLVQWLQFVHLKNCQPELVEGGLSEESIPASTSSAWQLIG